MGTWGIKEALWSFTRFWQGDIRVKKKALISVSSKQKGAVDDAIEVITPGVFFKEEDKFVVCYEETEISGMDGTTTTLEIYKDYFILIREGTTNSKMKFSSKNSDVILYNTPHGALELSFSVHNVEINLNEDGGTIFANYDISIEGQQAINTAINVDITVNSPLP